jgi:hypothetical protein
VSRPAPPEQLRRGSVCLVHRQHPSAGGTTPELLVLLQDPGRGGRDQVMAATLHPVTERVRRRAGFYARLAAGQHPAALLVPPDRVRGATDELYVGLLTITPLRLADVVDRRGSLTEEDMRQVSERLVRTLELDISRFLRAGMGVSRDPARAGLPWWSRREDGGGPRPG